MAVWRELRKIGALSLGQGSWAVPDVALTPTTARAIFTKPSPLNDRIPRPVPQAAQPPPRVAQPGPGLGLRRRNRRGPGISGAKNGQHLERTPRRRRQMAFLVS
ncbi:Chromate resistance protein ChrB [Nocardia sp. NPDC050710]|uniref:Chromate resistance protein ChrB n=1 Tax=Nocardia sp. NPDC050710 TaxID=3157220 RepID=UPI0033CA67E4